MQRIPEAHPETSGFDRDRHTAQYGYNARNEMIERNQHFGGVAWLQSVDYTYNDQGWLTAINQATLGGTNIAFPTCTTSVVNPGVTTTGQADDTKDLFYMALQYNTLHAGLSGTARTDGNISQAVWRVRGRERQAYSFTYDGLQRITAATYSDMNDAGTVTASNRYNTSYTYADLRGNISNLQRNGMYLSGACYSQALLDNLTYTPVLGTNKISSITEGANASQGGYRAASGTYTYDVNGNLKSDPTKSITNINYNHLNLPILVDYGGGKVIEFTYTADGKKVKKVVKNTGGTIVYTQDYSGGIEYKNGVIDVIHHDEGRLFNNTGWKREYTIKDHLGNSRITYSDLNNDGVVATSSEILQENHYDAFGAGLDGVYMNHVNADNPYMYNSKEFNNDFNLGWYAYGNRQFDPVIARFTGVDPIADQFPHVSTFNYAENDPISNIDLHGLQKWSFKEMVKTTGAFVAGVSNAVASNALLNAPGTRGDPSAFGNYSQAASFGQTVGDAISVGIGIVEIAGSITGVLGEAVATPFTGGASALAIVPTAGLAVHGSAVTVTAIRNLLNPTRLDAKADKKREQREQARQKREEQPASEDFGKKQAKALKKKEGPDAARNAHDAKEKGAPDRTKKQLREDYKNQF